MTSKPLVDLTYQTLSAEERQPFHRTLHLIFEEDERKQALTIPPYNYRAILMAARSADGTIVGGFKAETGWNELYVNVVAVNPEYRGAGIGTALMQHAEAMARTELDCNVIRVDVFDWQPRALFDKVGYTEFGVQDDFPHGHTRHLLQKVWAAGAEAADQHVYAKAASGLTFGAWDAKEDGATVLQRWTQQATAAHTASSPHPVPALEPHFFTIKVTYPNGFFAAGVACVVTWNELHINLLAVAPAEQRRGVGTAIMHKLNEVAREHHCEYIGLETSEWQGRSFYEKNGFTCFATQQGIPNGFERYRLFRRVPST